MTLQPLGRWKTLIQVLTSLAAGGSPRMGAHIVCAAISGLPPAARIFLRVVSVLAALSTASAHLRAEEPSPRTGLHIPTMGGRQFWADEFFFHQWRIQRNVITGHCRLLDGKNLRHGSGTLDDCRRKLKQIRRDRKLAPMRGKAVIVLHGLFRSGASMKKLCRYLEERGGYTVFNVDYPSTRRGLGAHARTLARIIQNLDGIEEINFVAHSMGNIVVRHYLADRTSEESPSETPRRMAGGWDPRIKRLVMLAPPNHGSLLAFTLAENKVLDVVTGDSIRQLGLDWAKLEGKLATPSFEFGIIAGGRGNGQGYNPLLPGDDDGTLSVASTQLAGARDFVVVPVLHPSIVNDKKALEYTLRFLQKGYFISAEARQPVEEE